MQLVIQILTDFTLGYTAVSKCFLSSNCPIYFFEHLNISLHRIPKDDNLSPELGIIIAKKRLKDVPTTGFLVVHIEPDGLIDR